MHFTACLCWHLKIQTYIYIYIYFAFHFAFRISSPWKHHHGTIYTPSGRSVEYFVIKIGTRLQNARLQEQDGDRERKREREMQSCEIGTLHMKMNIKTVSMDESLGNRFINKYIDICTIRIL